MKSKFTKSVFLVLRQLSIDNQTEDHQNPKTNNKVKQNQFMISVCIFSTEPENSLLETILHWEGTETGEEIDKFPKENATNATKTDRNNKEKTKMRNK